MGVADAAEIVDDTLSKVLDAVGSEIPDARAHPSLTSDIATFTENLIAGRAAGAPAAEQRA
ncbi:hypothetical protein NKG05_25470 [Oerskovia sp. M15]